MWAKIKATTICMMILLRDVRKVVWMQKVRVRIPNCESGSSIRLDYGEQATSHKPQELRTLFLSQAKGFVSGFVSCVLAFYCEPICFIWIPS